MGKYKNKIATVDGITFDSHREARRWYELSMLEKAGEIQNLRRQEKFELIPSQRIDGAVVERPVAYKADFVYEENGKMVVEDSKSPATKTKDYIIKRKLMLYKYGIQIREV